MAGVGSRHQLSRNRCCALPGMCWPMNSCACIERTVQGRGKHVGSQLGCRVKPCEIHTEEQKGQIASIILNFLNVLLQFCANGVYTGKNKKHFVEAGDSICIWLLWRPMHQHLCATLSPNRTSGTARGRHPSSVDEGVSV